MNFASCAWLWLYAGAFLMLMELLAPGFVIFFFGLSAATVGLFRAVIGEAFSPTWQMVAFSVFSILYLVVLRRWLKKTFSGSVESASTDFSNEYVGRVGKVTEAIRPPLTGRVMLGDSEWTAASDRPVEAGANVKVVAQQNLTMKVEEI